MSTNALFTLPFLITAIFAHASAHASDRYVATTGSDAANNCLNSLAPCLTLQNANDQSANGDVIHMAAGTYAVAGLVTINKSLSVLGAQAGVDARTRVASETILSNTQGLSVAADNCTFDGLTIRDSSNPAYTGYGIWINPGKNGTQVINNIFTNNVAGLGISNGGATQALVQHNLFDANNLAGGAGGTGIYTDQFVSGAVDNVLITENRFVNNENAGIGFSNSDLTLPDTNITVTDNVFDNCGRGIYFINTRNSVVRNNQITNLVAPTDTGSSVAVGIYGAVQNLTVDRNNFLTGVRYGVRIADFLEVVGSQNVDLAIHLNNIVGFATAGMEVSNAPSGFTNFATCNWWGSDTGPTNAVLNPSGTGDDITGTLTVENFNPWLLGLAPDSPCGTDAPTVSKVFLPSTIKKKDKSVLKITLSNPNDVDAVVLSPFVDNLPDHVFVHGNGSTTCAGGVVTADFASTSITLTGGVIPALGSCTVSAVVYVDAVGEFINTISVGDLVTSVGTNAGSAEASLKVLRKSAGRAGGGGGTLWLPIAPAPLATEPCVDAVEMVPVQEDAPALLTPSQSKSSRDEDVIVATPKKTEHGLSTEKQGCATHESMPLPLLLALFASVRRRRR